jgi:4-amino-4-deoxy-L-arabinose transferase-like glycosyltransferase
MAVEDPASGVAGERTRTYRWSVLLAAALGFSLRVAWCAQRALAPGFKFGFDEYMYYVSTAMNAFSGRGFFPEYNHLADGVYVPPPLQSLFVLAVYTVSGRVLDLFWVTAVQSLIAGLTIVFSAEIGRMLAGARAGILAGLLVALYPAFVYWSGVLTTESNYLFLLSLAVLLVCRFAQTSSIRSAIGAAMALGFLDLQRVNALYLGPLLALFAARKLGLKRSAIPAIAFLALPFLVVAPWLARNLSVYGEPIWVNSNGGILFHFGNRLNLDSRQTPYWDSMHDDHGPAGPYIPALEEKLRDEKGRLKVTYYEYSKAYFAVARGYVFEHPLHFARNYFWKFVNQFWLPQDAGPDEGLFSVGLNRVLHWLVLIGGLLGLGLLLRSWREAGSVLVLAIFFAYFALIGGFFALTADGRLNLFSRWMLLLFLAGGASVFIRTVIRRRA